MNKKVLLYGGIALVVILGVLFVVSLISSKNEGTNSSAEGDSSQTGPVILEYWGLWEAEAVIQPLIDKYQAQNPNVTIHYTQKSFTQYEENVYTRVKEGSIEGSPAPDILRVHNSWLSKFQGYLYPASPDVIDRSTLAEKYYPTVSKDFVGTDGYVYAIPLEIDGLALYYNKALLQGAGYTEPPKTWDAVIEAAKKLTKTNANGEITQAGLAMGSAANIRHSADILCLLMEQNGVEPINDTNTEVALTGDRAVSSLEFYTDFVEVHKTWSPDVRSDLEMFYTGKLAMMIAPSWGTFDILNSNSAIEFGVVPTPILGTDEVYYAHYWGEAVSRNSQNPAEAWKFIKYMAEEAQLKEMYSNSSQIRAFGEPYALTSMNSILIDEPYVGAIMEMAPNFSAWKKGEEAYVNESLNIAIDDVVSADVDVEDALYNAQKRINEKLASSIQ